MFEIDTKKDLHEWLDHLALSDFTDDFVNARWHGSRLLELTREDLADVRIPKRHQAAVLSALDDLRRRITDGRSSEANGEASAGNTDKLSVSGLDASAALRRRKTFSGLHTFFHIILRRPRRRNWPAASIGLMRKGI